jgi:hypothetical protein
VARSGLTPEHMWLVADMPARKRRIAIQETSRDPRRKRPSTQQPLFILPSFLSRHEINQVTSAIATQHGICLDPRHYPVLASARPLLLPQLQRPPPLVDPRWRQFAIGCTSLRRNDSNPTLHIRKSGLVRDDVLFCDRGEWQLLGRIARQEVGFPIHNQSDSKINADQTSQISLEPLAERPAFQRPGLVDEQQCQLGQHQYVLSLTCASVN